MEQGIRPSQLTGSRGYAFLMNDLWMSIYDPMKFVLLLLTSRRIIPKQLS
jgi:hypothetical protein